MSGICGLLALDGRALPPGEIDGMTAPLERRGPDGTRTWQDGCVALGHTLLATTPESLVEELPLTDPASGCTITADVRLDNREQLIATLALSNEPRAIGDGELILRSYLRWGEECPTKLLGDFAFAIWDPRRKHLFCARDHMGMRQLIYCHLPGRLFLCATEPEAILAHPEAPRRINEGRIADFLDDMEGLDLSSTFFEAIHRLPPAHSLTVSSEFVCLRRYWRLSPGPRLELDSDEAYAAAFLEVFSEAIRCRLRSATPVGSMLSGGTDSGSVAAIAARLLAADGREPLQTFSAVGPDPEACVETRAILSTAALPGLAAHFISHAEMAKYQNALMRFLESGEPFDYHMTMVRAVYLAAHDRGVKIMLDGVAGDVVLAAGNRVAQLLRRGRVVQAIREARGESRFWGPKWPSWKTVPKAAWVALVPPAIRDRRRMILAHRHDRRIGKAGLTSRSFAKQIDLKGRRKRFRAHLQYGSVSDAEQRVQAIVHPHLTVARERYDRVASALAIEPRDPFIDLRVIEFCLSLPAEQLQSGGWPKLILRRALRGTLPDAVTWRRGKEHLGWTFTRALFAGWSGWSEQLERESSWIAGYVRPAMLHHGSPGRGKALDIEGRFKLFFLLRWLRRSTSNVRDASPMSEIIHAEEKA